MPARCFRTRRRRLVTVQTLAMISAAMATTLIVPDALSQQTLRFSKAEDHFATGRKSAVASTSREASEAALWAMAQGGNAADAYLAAALTQTVVEHGLTSIGGGFSIHYFDAARGETNSVVGPLGPAKSEPYDFDRTSPVTQTGRAMPVPGFLSGVHAAHNRFGELKWDLLFRQYRIMEEVFLATRRYSKENHKQFVSPEYARAQADVVLNGPRRKLTFDLIFNTSFLVVRDRAGNVAWGTHSINTPTSFGAGIMVDGVYAAHAMNRDHVLGTGASAPGISTSIALYKDGRPRLIAGSPGFGFVHGPWQYCTGIVEWGLSPAEAMNQPRFGLPARDRGSYFESHYDDRIFEMLKKRDVSFVQGRPSPFTGLVGALTINDDQTALVVQDGRADGYARAE